MNKWKLPTWKRYVFLFCFLFCFLFVLSNIVFALRFQDFSQVVMIYSTL